MLQRIDASLGQSYQQWRCSSHPHHNWARNFKDSLERIAMTLRIPCELRIQERFNAAPAMVKCRTDLKNSYMILLFLSSTATAASTYYSALGLAPRSHRM